MLCRLHFDTVFSEFRHTVCQILIQLHMSFISWRHWPIYIFFFLLNIEHFLFNIAFLSTLVSSAPPDERCVLCGEDREDPDS